MGNTSPHGKSPSAPNPIAEFQAVTQDALDHADSSCGAETLEPYLVRALTILQRNLDLRPQFENELISLIDPIKEGVVELISFVMHELRWPKIEEAIRDKMRDPERNVSDFRHYEAMLDGFSDSWRDRDLYVRFDR